MQPVIMRGSPESIQGLMDLMNFAESHIGDLTKKTMVEIGCYTGESTVVFAPRFHKVYAIDPFQNGYDSTDVASFSVPFSMVENQFDERSKPFLNIVKVKNTSDEAFRLIPKKVDLVYIDGMHTYEQVKKDIANYLPLLSDKAVIAGHDYCWGWEGVMNAVNEAFGRPDQTFIDGSWAKAIIK